MPRAARSPFPSTPGTYVLILESAVRRRIAVGALGSLDVEPGFYAYVGSALGSGGLSGRLARHLRRTPKPHWHIDSLRRHTQLREIWFAQGAALREHPLREHRWAGALGSAPSASIPLARFGATDCRCPSHLFRFPRVPRVSAFRRQCLDSADPDRAGSHPGIVRWVPA